MPRTSACGSTSVGPFAEANPATVAALQSVSAVAHRAPRRGKTLWIPFGKAAVS